MAETPRVAIACQGGGSLTAYTAGVLEEVLRHPEAADVVALSGTSGGAMCAALAWDGLVADDPDRAIENLCGFWADVGASDPFDRAFNEGLVRYVALEETGVPTPEVSPYDNPFASWGRRRLRRTLERYVDFEAAAESPVDPAIRVGAVDVTEDSFRVFADEEVTADAVLASAALPSLFPAVEIDGRLYWDGLLSENPPVRTLAELNPDEIWVVQVDGIEHAAEPRTTKEITDRRNLLAGNLSLNQELQSIEFVNGLVESGVLDDERYTDIRVERVVLEDEALGYAEKLDRDADFLAALYEKGEAEAAAFLESRS